MVIVERKTQTGIKMMTTAQTQIVIQMGCTVPANAQGYVSDLLYKNATPRFIADRLELLRRYCPSLVQQFVEASE